MSSRNKVALITGVTVAKMYAYWITVNYHEAYATVEQLVVLSNLESINAELIRQGVTQVDRLNALNATAIHQMRSLLASPAAKKLK